MGLNQNHSSHSGTSYHVQIEDRGPVFDDAAEEWVRRVNVIAYANYGEPTARIVYGKDHDFPDFRTHEHNRTVAQRIQELAGEARQVLEEKEERQVGRIKSLLERYYRTRDEHVKSEIEEANALYPFVFARAFQQLKAERPGTSEPEAAGPGRDRLPARSRPAGDRPRDRARERGAPAGPGGAEGARSGGRHPPGDLREAPGPGEGQPHAEGHVERVRGPLPRA